MRNGSTVPRSASTSMRRLWTLATILVLASLGVAFVPGEPAQARTAAPVWCKAWKVSGQTWYANQSDGFTLMFTLTLFSGFARHNRGAVTDVNLGGIPSQYIKGGVTSDGVGRIMMDLLWTNGHRGQYHATAVMVRRTASGGLTAGLHGTMTVTSGGVGTAHWYAYGQSSGIGTSGGRFFWPLYCARGDVVRYPAVAID